MKIKLALFLLSVALSSCTDKEDLESIKIEQSVNQGTPSQSPKQGNITPDILDGNYKGYVKHEVMTWTGSSVEKSKGYTMYDLNFSIAGNTFSRPECGCDGNIEINKDSLTVKFTSKSPNCIGSNYRNYIINEFHYKIEAGVITIYRQDRDLTVADVQGKYGKGSGFFIQGIVAKSAISPTEF